MVPQFVLDIDRKLLPSGALRSVIHEPHLNAALVREAHASAAVGAQAGADRRAGQRPILSSPLQRQAIGNPRPNPLSAACRMRQL